MTVKITKIYYIICISSYFQNKTLKVKEKHVMFLLNCNPVEVKKGLKQHLKHHQVIIREKLLSFKSKLMKLIKFWELEDTLTPIKGNQH